MTIMLHPDRINAGCLYMSAKYYQRWIKHAEYSEMLQYAAKDNYIVYSNIVNGTPALASHCHLSSQSRLETKVGL